MLPNPIELLQLFVPIFGINRHLRFLVIKHIVGDVGVNLSTGRKQFDQRKIMQPRSGSNPSLWNRVRKQLYQLLRMLHMPSGPGSACGERKSEVDGNMRRKGC